MSLSDKMKALKEQEQKTKEQKVKVNKDGDVTLDKKNDKPSNKVHKPVDMVTIPEDEFDNLITKINIALALPISIDDELVKEKQNYRRKNGKTISKTQIIINILKNHYNIS